MEAQELRQLSIEELRGRVRQWREDLFRVRFKAGRSESGDTSVFRKLRADIARTLTVMNEKLQAGDSGAKPVVESAAVVESKEAGEKKPASKKAGTGRKKKEVTANE